MQITAIFGICWYFYLVYAQKHRRDGLKSFYYIILLWVFGKILEELMKHISSM
jgi:hypothetical protein